MKNSSDTIGNQTRDCVEALIQFNNLKHCILLCTIYINALQADSPYSSEEMDIINFCLYVFQVSFFSLTKIYEPASDLIGLLLQLIHILVILLQIQTANVL